MICHLLPCLLWRRCRSRASRRAPGSWWRSGWRARSAAALRPPTSKAARRARRPGISPGQTIYLRFKSPVCNMLGTRHELSAFCFIAWWLNRRFYFFFQSWRLIPQKYEYGPALGMIETHISVFCRNPYKIQLIPLLNSGELDEMHSTNYLKLRLLSPCYNVGIYRRSYYDYDRITTWENALWKDATASCNADSYFKLKIK